MSDITTTTSRVVYRNRWMEVREDAITHADGSPGLYGVVHKPDFSLVIPATNTGYYLIEQYRYPAGGRYWEFPQGSWEDQPDADPAELARGELAEETGLRAGTVTPIGVFHEAYGYCTQRAHVFLATNLTQGAASPSPEEGDLRCEHVAADELPRMVARGQITDGATLAAYMLLRVHSAGTATSLT